MIKPHGSDNLNPLYVQDDKKRAELIKEAEGLPSIVVSSAAAGNAVMLGSGYFNPLVGFMNKADALGVAKDMKTSKGLFWPTPVLNVVNPANAMPSRQLVKVSQQTHPVYLLTINGYRHSLIKTDLNVIRLTRRLPG